MSCANNRGSGEGSSTGQKLKMCSRDKKCHDPPDGTFLVWVVLVTCSSGMQQIYEQIKKRQEDKNMQDEMKNHEREQLQERQEMMNLEDFKV